MDFAEWHPISWSWTSPGGVCFTIAALHDFIDGKVVEYFGLYANGCAMGKFSTMERAKERAAVIANEVVT